MNAPQTNRLGITNAVIAALLVAAVSSVASTVITSKVLGAEVSNNRSEISSLRMAREDDRNRMLIKLDDVQKRLSCIEGSLNMLVLRDKGQSRQ